MTPACVTKFVVSPCMPPESQVRTKLMIFVFALLLLFDTPLVSHANQTTSSGPQQQTAEVVEKTNRRRVSPQAMRRRANNPWVRMLETVERSVGKQFPLFFGLSMMTAGVCFFFLREARKQGKSPSAVSTKQKVSLLLLAILAAGSILRLYNLAEKPLDHTEIFVPGIPLPEDLSAPPPRITAAETFYWHFHVEPHPPGYYFLMWPWTKLFGTSEFVLRLPSALFGIASIWLIFQLVSLTHNRLAAGFAATLLALNGHHIFWSQMARMYAMTCFLGLLSTLLLFRIVRSPVRRLLREAAYAGVSLMGLFTEILFWPFLAVQAFWVGIILRDQEDKPDRILRLQAIVMMVGTLLWAHAVYRARPSPLAQPTLSFLQHFFTFGFLIHPDPFALHPQEVAIFLVIPLLVIGLTLLFFAYQKRPGSVAYQSAKDPGLWITLPICLGAICTTIGYSLHALIRRQGMAKTIFVAIVALFVPWTLSKLGQIVRWAGRRFRFESFLQSADLPFYLLALIPAVGVFLLSYRVSLLGTRLFLLFVPFPLALIAIGLARLESKRILFVPAVAIVLIAHLFSIQHFHNALSTPVDYKTLAKEINERFQEGDLIFVRAKHWAVTPLFYYLRDHQSALIAAEFDKAIAERQPGKVFVIRFVELPPTPQMQEAVKRLHLREVVEERRAYADIYSR